jgi:hypothetical protein
VGRKHGTAGRAGTCRASNDLGELQHEPRTLFGIHDGRNLVERVQDQEQAPAIEQLQKPLIEKAVQA